MRKSNSNLIICSESNIILCCWIKLKFFKRTLSFLAYSCKDGPWKHAYVRFGYDCRAETEAFIYQVLDIGVLDSTSLHENLVQSHKKNDLYFIFLVPHYSSLTSETYDPTFSEAPTKVRQLYQLCDIQDAAVIDILTKERTQIQKSEEIECHVYFFIIILRFLSVFVEKVWMAQSKGFQVGCKVHEIQIQIKLIVTFFLVFIVPYCILFFLRIMSSHF